jgi:trk system potassium uptake protein TrkH
MSTHDPLAVLHYAVRARVLGKHLGGLLIVVAALTTVPAIVAFLQGEHIVASRMAVVIGVLTLAAVPLARLKIGAVIQPNEALVVAALTYLLCSAAMVYPFMTAGAGVLDAWFESVSAVTTTGLSTMPSPERLPRSLLFARAWMQWYGGLGVVVFSVALLAGHDMSARRLVGSAANESLVTTTRVYARRMVAVYLALSLFGVVLLVMLGVAPFDAFSHVMAAVSTGGFSTDGASLAAFEGWGARAGIMFMSLLGAVSLPLYYAAYRGDRRVLARDAELRAFLLATALVCATLYVLEFGFAAPSGERLGHALVMGVSAQTTTGFSTVPVTELSAASKALLLLAMAAGGSIGSTAGGVKWFRLVLLLQLFRLTLRRVAMPMHAVAELRLGGQRVESEEVGRATLVILLFLLTVLLSWIPFLALGYDALDALFEVVSATGTVGLSAGISAPELEPGLKALLCVDMLLGRVEFIALLILFYPPTWVGRRSAAV